MFEKKKCKTLEKNIYKVHRTQNINHIWIFFLIFFGIRTDPQAIIQQEVVLFFFYVPV